MTIIDLFRDFSFTASMNGYPTPARSLYYTLLYVWNERRRPDTVQLTAKELHALAGLPEATFRRAFEYLANRGWVKRFQSRNRVLFTYSLRENGVSVAEIGGSNAPATRENQRKNSPTQAANSSTTTEETARGQRTDSTVGAIPSNRQLEGIRAATSPTARVHQDPLPDDIF